MLETDVEGNGRMMTPDQNRIFITELRTLKEWDAFSQIWDDLLFRSPDASVFNSFSFLRCFYNKFLNLRSCRLAILMLKEESGQPIGAAPMIRLKKQISGLPVNVISLMFKRVITDRTQFLVPDRREEQLKAIFQYLQKDTKSWDVLELQEQVIDSEYESIVRSLFKDTSSYHQEIINPAIDPFLKMEFGPDGWEKYLLTRSKKHRKKWRYLQNRLLREGTVSVARHTEGEDLFTILAKYQELEQKSHKFGTPSTVSSKIREFYIELATALRPKGNMHFVFLLLDDTPIAGLIGMSFEDRYAALQTVFDEKFSKFSPGFLIGGYDMKWAMEKGFSEYDFMSGFLTDKLLWTDSFRILNSIRITRKRALGGLFYLTKFRMIPVIREILHKIGLDDMVEKLLGHQKWVLDKSKFEKHNIQLQGRKESLNFSNHSSNNSE
jgi:hypothetical protein